MVSVQKVILETIKYRKMQFQPNSFSNKKCVIEKRIYHISLHSFHGFFFFFLFVEFENCRKFKKFPQISNNYVINLFFSAETIQEVKLQWRLSMTPWSVHTLFNVLKGYGLTRTSLTVQAVYEEIRYVKKSKLSTFNFILPILTQWRASRSLKISNLIIFV